MRTAILICAGLTAVPAYGQAPACTDNRTIELVKRIFAQAIERRAAGIPQAKEVAAGIVARSSVGVESISTVKIDEKIDKHFCQGVMVVVLTQRSMSALNTPDGQALIARGFDTRSVRIAGNRATHDIRFTSQFIDDGKQHFAEVGGFQGLAELAYRFTAPEVADQLKSPSAKGDATPKPGDK